MSILVCWTWPRVPTEMAQDVADDVCDSWEEMIENGVFNNSVYDDLNVLLKWILHHISMIHLIVDIYNIYMY